MFFCVYCLQSEKEREFYVGYTNNLKRRIGEHNQGKNTSTRPYLPWKLIYYEACLDEQDARRREKYFKTTQGGRLLKRRLKEYLFKQK